MTRGRTVWALLLLAVAMLASTRPAWVTAQAQTAVATARVVVSGGEAAPGVAAGGAVVVAAALALALAGRVGALVAAVVAGLGSALVAASAIAVPGRAADVAAGAAGDQLGVDRVVGAAAGPWPWIGVVLGLVGVALAVVAARGARAWAGPSARHEGADRAGRRAGRGSARPAEPGRTAGEGPQDPGAAWDALSRGEDPS